MAWRSGLVLGWVRIVGINPKLFGRPAQDALPVNRPGKPLSAFYEQIDAADVVQGNFSLRAIHPLHHVRIDALMLNTRVVALDECCLLFSR